MTGANKEAIEARLQWIADRDGSLAADAVVKDAKNKKSPLHGEFEWDLEKAAIDAWRETARRLIRSVKVVVRTETIHVNVPRYVRNPDAGAREQSYSVAAELRTDHARARAALAYEIDRAEAAIRRCKDVALAVGLSDDVHELLVHLLDIKEAIRAA